MRVIEEGTDMKKHHVIRKLLCLALPFALLFAWFFAFEPYDWFSMKGDAWYMNRAISSKREVLNRHPENLIFGDSHIANLNTDYIASVGGGDWTMMAYGGATLNENIQDFWWAAEHTKIRRVVFGLTFYSLNDGHYSEGRHEEAVRMATDPWAFVKDFVHWDETFLNCRIRIRDLTADRTGREDLRIRLDDPSSLDQDTRPPEEYDGLYRKDLLNYVNFILPECQNYSCYNYCQRLEEVIRYCDENGIEIRFVLFNSNWTVWEKVIYALGIQGQMNFYTDFLKTRAEVIDLEADNEVAHDDSLFIDGFHVVLEEKLHLARIIFAGEECAYAQFSTPDTYVSTFR